MRDDCSGELAEANLDRDRPRLVGRIVIGECSRAQSSSAAERTDGPRDYPEHLPVRPSAFLSSAFSDSSEHSICTRISAFDRLWPNLSFILIKLRSESQRWSGVSGMLQENWRTRIGGY